MVFLELGVYDVWLGIDWLRLLVLLLCYFVCLGFMFVYLMCCLLLRRGFTIDLFVWLA